MKRVLSHLFALIGKGLKDGAFKPQDSELLVGLFSKLCTCGGEPFPTCHEFFNAAAAFIAKTVDAMGEEGSDVRTLAKADTTLALGHALQAAI
eukprot:5493190-Amphidinium_carterae.2